VGFGYLVADGHLVLAALGEAVWSGLVVSLVECAVNSMVVCALDDCTVICALDDARFLFLSLLLEVNFVDILSTVKRCAVAGDIIERSLTQFPVMVIDADDMEHFPRPNVDVYLAVSN